MEAEARNTDKDYYECLKNAANEVGHGGGYTEWVEVYYDDFDQMEKLYRKAAELYASLREAQAVADYKERVKAAITPASTYSRKNPGIAAQTEPRVYYIKRSEILELLDTTN
jgi:hypothetical protein